MKSYRSMMLETLCALRVYPHMFFSRSPLKMLEFNELVRDQELRSDDVVLDIGCGHGLQTTLLGTKAKKVIGIDIASDDLDAARRVARHVDGRANCEFRCERLERAGFPGDSFDKIYSFSVLEHIDNYEDVLRESYRILKPKGQLIFSCDTLESIDDVEIVETHKRKYYVQHYFNRAEMRRLLEEIGFKHLSVYPIFKSDYAKKLFIRNVTVPFSNDYIRPIIQYYRLRKAESHTNGATKGIFLIVRAMK